MIAHLQPYPEYKESGLPWVGRVPQGWNVQRTKWLFRHRKEINARRTHTNVLSLTLRGVVNNDPDDPEGLVPKDYGTYQFFRKGDLVFKLIDLENLRTSRVGLVHEDGIMSSAYVRLIPNKPSSVRFFFLQFYDLYTRGVYNQLGAGVRSTLGPADLLNLPICLPPPEEQPAIVRFLDYANGRIERAIRAKRKVIELLHEQKQALIHRAMTGKAEVKIPKPESATSAFSLPPSTLPMKPSGIPWLGDIPKHWEIIPLKFLCRRIQNGATPSTSEQRYYENGTVPWFGPSSVGTDSGLGAPVRYLTKAAFSYGKARLIKGPAILVIVIGATAGKMGLLVGEGATNQQITAFELKEGRILPEFGIQQLRSSENWLKSTASTATIPILDSGIVNRLPVAFPPLGEQQAVLSAISAQTQPLVTAMTRLEREIELLREYRTRLVAEVVTGKLDVRPAARQLPAESSEPEFGIAAGDSPDEEEIEPANAG